MEGNALVKSIDMQAPESRLKDVIMLASSMSTKFASNDLPGKKPCCLGEIHLARCTSYRFLAELAKIRLSHFTIFKGRVLPNSYTAVPSSSEVVDFLGRQTRMLSFKWCP